MSPNVRKSTSLLRNKKTLLIECRKAGLDTRSQFQENELPLFTITFRVFKKLHDVIRLRSLVSLTSLSLQKIGDRGKACEK